MANDFSGDANCVALYNLEAAGAQGTDSKSTNNLTPSNLDDDGADFKQGANSVVADNRDDPTPNRINLLHQI